MHVLLLSLQERLYLKGFGFLVGKLEENGFALLEIFSGYFFSIFLNKIDLRFSDLFLDLFLFEKEQFLFDFLLRNLWVKIERIYELVKDPHILVKFLANDLVSGNVEEFKDEFEVLLPFPIEDFNYN